MSALSGTSGWRPYIYAGAYGAFAAVTLANLVHRVWAQQELTAEAALVGVTVAPVATSLAPLANHVCLAVGHYWASSREMATCLWKQKEPSVADAVATMCARDPTCYRKTMRELQEGEERMYQAVIAHLRWESSQLDALKTAWCAHSFELIHLDTEALKKVAEICFAMAEQEGIPPLQQAAWLLRGVKFYPFPWHYPSTWEEKYFDQMASIKNEMRQIGKKLLRTAHKLTEGDEGSFDLSLIGNTIEFDVRDDIKAQKLNKDYGGALSDPVFKAFIYCLKSSYNFLHLSGADPSHTADRIIWAKGALESVHRYSPNRAHQSEEALELMKVAEFIHHVAGEQ